MDTIGMDGALDSCLAEIDYEVDCGHFDNRHIGDVIRCGINEHLDCQGVTDTMDRINFICLVMTAIQASIDTLEAKAVDLTASQAKYVINFTKQSPSHGG